MEFLSDFIHTFDPQNIVEFTRQYGQYAQFVTYIVLFMIVFAESGLLIGFFLPGDSLLFTTGFLASNGVLNIWILLPLLFFAAVFGDSAGYAFGRRVGRRLFEREKSLLFHKEHLLKAEQFYEKHGKKTIILARFMPVVRTFAPIVAGIAHMEYRTFVAYNVIGGFLWAVGLTVLGYFLGKIPFVRQNLEIAVLVVIFVSIAPALFHIFKDPKHRKQFIMLLKNPRKALKREQKIISEEFGN